MHNVPELQVRSPEGHRVIGLPRIWGFRVQRFQVDLVEVSGWGSQGQGRILIQEIVALRL